MRVIEYFLPDAADQPDLSAWASLLPSQFRVLRTSLFGDPFLVDGTGAVHMLDRGGCSVERIATSEEEFWQKIQDDEQGWLLRPLADECQRDGKTLSNGQCYAFTTPPILGGDYSADNVWVAPWKEWFSFTSDLFKQIESLPDGSAASLKVVD